VLIFFYCGRHGFDPHPPPVHMRPLLSASPLPRLCGRHKRTVPRKNCVLKRAMLGPRAQMSTTELFQVDKHTQQYRTQDQ